MKNLSEFAAVHGIKAIVRRHFDYRPGIPERYRTERGIEIGDLNYTRLLEASNLGLNLKGTRMAIKQGEMLGAWRIIPKLVLCGLDQRNKDGAKLTAEAVEEATGEKIPVLVSQSASYPTYSDPALARKNLLEFGDGMVHKWLAGHEDISDLCTESAEVFSNRVIGSVTASCGTKKTPTLFDLNFEAIVLLYHVHVLGLRRQDIPCQNIWLPAKGGSIVYGADGTVKLFDPNFILAE